MDESPKSLTAITTTSTTPELAQKTSSISSCSFAIKFQDENPRPSKIKFVTDLLPANINKIRVRRNSKGGDRPVSITLDKKRTTARELSNQFTESLRKHEEEGIRSQSLLWNSDQPNTMGSTTCSDDNFAKLNNVQFEFMGTDGRRSIAKSDSGDYMDLIDYQNQFEFQNIENNLKDQLKAQLQKNEELIEQNKELLLEISRLKDSNSILNQSYEINRMQLEDYIKSTGAFGEATKTWFTQHAFVHGQFSNPLKNSAEQSNQYKKLVQSENVAANSFTGQINQHDYFLYPPLSGKLESEVNSTHLQEIRNPSTHKEIEEEKLAGVSHNDSEATLDELEGEDDAEMRQSHFCAQNIEHKTRVPGEREYPMKPGTMALLLRVCSIVLYDNEKKTVSSINRQIAKHPSFKDLEQSLDSIKTFKAKPTHFRHTKNKSTLLINKTKKPGTSTPHKQKDPPASPSSQTKTKRISKY